jgi:hypothetical protein
MPAFAGVLHVVPADAAPRMAPQTPIVTSILTCLSFSKARTAQGSAHLCATAGGGIGAILNQPPAATASGHRAAGSSKVRKVMEPSNGCFPPPVTAQQHREGTRLVDMEVGDGSVGARGAIRHDVASRGDKLTGCWRIKV